MDVVSIALRLAPTRDDSFSGLESLTLIALSCNQKLSLAGQQTAKHDGLYPLLSVSLTVPPFVEHFQQRDDPCHVGFYAFNSLSLLSSDSISESYIQLLSNVACIKHVDILHHAQRGQNAYTEYARTIHIDVLSTSMGLSHALPNYHVCNLSLLILLRITRGM